MKEIETLVEEKKKDSTDMAKMISPQESRFNLPAFLRKLLTLEPFYVLTRRFCPGGAPQSQDDVRVSMTGEQLNGSQRVLLDKVIAADECGQLQRLSNVSRTLHSSELRSELQRC